MPSRRDLIRMSDEEVEAFLHERHVMNIATIAPDGSIHLVAMWYGFVNGNPAFATFAKSQKVRNVERDDRITCLVEDGHGYEELRGVEIVGRAVIHDDQDLVLGLAADVATRYYGIDDPDDARAVAEGIAKKRVAIEVVPTRVLSWDHRKLGGVY